MGAALTYARRYALFTLVGIAGEDDLDAPDLGVIVTEPNSPNNGGAAKPNGSAGSDNAALSATAVGRNWSRNPRPSKPVLNATVSASVRDRLVGEIAALDAADSAIEWAGQNLDAKNTLAAGDAVIVEDAFRDRMRLLQPDVYTLEGAPAPEPDPPAERAPDNEPTRIANPAALERTHEPKQPRSRSSAMRMESMSGVSSVKPRRCRDKDHLRFICKQPCTLCGRTPCEAHHLRFAQPRAMGRRASDEFTVPLCRLHHRELHRVGNELAWWKERNIDPLPIALRFWQQTRGVVSTHEEPSPGARIAGPPIAGPLSGDARGSPPTEDGGAAP
jgi:hypothetical protein